MIFEVGDRVILRENVYDLLTDGSKVSVSVETFLYDGSAYLRVWEEGRIRTGMTGVIIMITSYRGVAISGMSYVIADDTDDIERRIVVESGYSVCFEKIGSLTYEEMLLHRHKKVRLLNLESRHCDSDRV